MAGLCGIDAPFAIFGVISFTSVLLNRRACLGNCFVIYVGRGRRGWGWVITLQAGESCGMRGGGWRGVAGVFFFNVMQGTIPMMLVRPGVIYVDFGICEVQYWMECNVFLRPSNWRLCVD